MWKVRVGRACREHSATCDLPFTNEISQRNQIRNIPAYNLEVEEWIDEEQFEPRYNIAPRSRAPVVRRRDGSARNGANDVVLHTMKWGLVPHWSKFEDTKLNTMNARSENLVEGGGMWGSIKGKHRCAVVCQGSVLLGVEGNICELTRCLMVY